MPTATKPPLSRSKAPAASHDKMIRAGLKSSSAGPGKETGRSRQASASQSMVTTKDKELRRDTNQGTVTAGMVSQAYNTACGLYSERRYRDAIPHFEQALTILDQATEQRAPAILETNSSPQPATDDSELHNIKQRFAILDVLASCYRTTGQTELYLAAVQRALGLLPGQQIRRLAHLTGTRPPADIFSQKEWIRIGALGRDLLDHSFSRNLRTEAESTADVQFDFTHVLQLGSDPQSTDAGLCKAAILEDYLLKLLDQNNHQQSSLDAIAASIAFCLDIYTSARHPIRRARLHLHLLEIEMLRPSSRSSDDLLELVDTALSLLEAPSSQDADLTPSRPYYTATVYLLRLQILQHHSSGSADQDVLKTAERAIVILQELADTLDTTFKDTITLKSASRTAILRSAAVPVTPPRKSVLSDVRSHATEEAMTIPQSQSGHLNDLVRLCSDVEVACELLSAYGDDLVALKLLRVLRRLYRASCAQSQTEQSNLTRCCVSLSMSYLSLGQPAKAQEALRLPKEFLRDQMTGSSLTADTISPEARLRCLLVDSETCCVAGDLDTATKRYMTALEVAAGLRPSKQRHRWQVGLEQVLNIERQALASGVCASLRLAGGNLDGAIAAASTSCRHWYRAVSLLGKFCATTSSGTRASGTRPSSGNNVNATKIEDDDPFGPGPSSTTASQNPATLPHAESKLQATTKSQASVLQDLQTPSRSFAAVYWRCGRQLIASLMRCSTLLLKRGSGREAELYATEAVQTASALNVPITSARCLIHRADLKLLMGREEEGQVDLEEARSLLGAVLAHEASSDSARVEGEALLRRRAADEAIQSFEVSQAALDEIKMLFQGAEGIDASPAATRSIKSRSSLDATQGRMATPGHQILQMLPNAQARLLIRQAQATLLRGDRAASAASLERMFDLQVTADLASHGKGVAGEIALEHALRALSKHQVLGSLTDSVTSAPMISASSKTIPPSGSKTIIKALSSARAAFLESIRVGHGLGESSAMRRTMSSMALTDVLLQCLDKGSGRQVQGNETGNYYHIGGAVTVMREYLEAIRSKLAEAVLPSDEAKWLPVEPSRRKSDLGPSPEWSRLWASIEEDTRSTGATQKKTTLPSNWSIVSISFIPDRNSIMVTRQGGDGDQVTVHLPVDRMSKREGDDEHLSVEAAISQMSTLTASINEGVHGTKGVSGREAKLQWWEQRRSLDRELQELMTTIESCWLGAFKTLLMDPTRAASEDLLALREKLSNVLDHACAPNAKAGVKIKLDRAILECFARLRPETATDEDLEDLIHFVTDTFQVGGASVAIDEVDLDQCVLGVRSALEEFWSKQGKAVAEGRREEERDDHLFLVLDKDACALPWESLSILRDRPVSRIPSLQFVQDRIKMAPLFCASQPGAEADGRFYQVKKPRTFWLLNPGRDLKRTEERMQPWLNNKQSRAGWRGITGRNPIMDELPKALEESDLFTYFGHGGAEAYIRSGRIRKLKRCAVTMLWGCSSGLLRDQGEFDRTGTPLHYMLAGAPALVANLWDVTDLELDRVCESVFCKLGLMDPEERAVKSLIALDGSGEARKSAGSMSLVRAVAESRRDCRLPYLTGGACVTYGVPVYFS
ncbi:separin protein [Tilletia horrida]|uniref:separase n=1 Tax=Tilletia horrida TaxID=155126 RepID=A0AAN6GPA0_9BASI|nr:separin protein [Tilletia horrida]KAK0547133.1 separin protein [Tilletia horrida]